MSDEFSLPPTDDLISRRRLLRGGAAAAASLGVNVAAGGVKSVTSSTSYLADQSAKQIVTQVNNFASQQGWNPTSPNSKTL